MTDIKLYLGDCLDIMPMLAAGSVDAIITDLPYGTTACSWDTIIPFPDLWRVVKHVLKPRGVFVTTASQPFTSMLVMSNLEWFRQEMIWDKVLPVGFLDANRRHMRRHENILLFSPIGYPIYNPIMITRGGLRKKGSYRKADVPSVYHAHKGHVSESNKYYPTTIIQVSNGDRTRDEVGYHSTQKPIALYEYLILTYTNPGETVLDMCAGSGTTGVACVNTGRSFIGVEIDPTYYAIAEKRIKQAQLQERMPI